MLDVSADTAAIYSDFAISVTFTPASGSPVTTNAIFTEPAEVFDLLESQMTAVAPTLMVATSEITDVRKGDSVTVDAREFTIERIQKCGTEDSVVYLKT